MKTVKMSEYRSAVNEDLGYCTSCEDFTTGCVEPDAQEYECAICGDGTVYGAEECVVMGLFAVR